jgi:hypothetical protein
MLQVLASFDNLVGTGERAFFVQPDESTVADNAYRQDCDELSFDGFCRHFGAASLPAL